MRTLYTDGSYDNGVSGWAVVERGECVHQDWSRGLTSNLAEGLAILAALKLVGEDNAYILSDSQTWVNAFRGTNKMKGKMSSEILAEGREILHTGIELCWVQGHTDFLIGNVLADQYAKQARMCKLSIDYTL